VTFGRGRRGPIICYNCNQPGHLARDCQNLCTTCTYYRELDHAIEDYPQLVAKWKTRGNPTQNQNQNVQVILTERCNEGPIVAVITH
jgi:hypothetical protein